VFFLAVMIPCNQSVQLLFFQLISFSVYATGSVNPVLAFATVYYVKQGRRHVIL
jgi:hypothetical protein